MRMDNSVYTREMTLKNDRRTGGFDMKVYWSLVCCMTDSKIKIGCIGVKSLDVNGGARESMMG